SSCGALTPTPSPPLLPYPSLFASSPLRVRPPRPRLLALLPAAGALLLQPGLQPGLPRTFVSFSADLRAPAFTSSTSPTSFTSSGGGSAAATARLTAWPPRPLPRLTAWPPASRQNKKGGPYDPPSPCISVAGGVACHTRPPRFSLPPPQAGSHM